MRLINVDTGEFKEFYSDIPTYGILSHTWGADEVSFQVYLSGQKQSGAGYAKIQQCEKRRQLSCLTSG